jgi:hypothetical protein
MPAPERVDPTMPDPLAERLTRSGQAAMDASHELLAHYADTGDAVTQRTVDTLIDGAALALQTLTDSLAEAARGLDAVASMSRTSPGRTRTGRGRSHIA